jgi:glycosyltransferase involved in cell wall biosynthesis
MELQQFISIIIPVFNEQGNLIPLYTELKEVLQDIGVKYEMIFIDDGSTDNSFQELSDIHASDKTVKVIQFRRNFGQTAAFAAGFDAAQGDLILTIDSDGQNDPHDIPKLLSKLQEGDYDFVIGWRINRKEPALRRMLSKAANLLISRSSKIEIHDRGCSLKLFTRDVIRNIRLYGQLHRFIPELASSIGVRIAEIPVNDRPRITGSSKYGSITRTPRVFLDLITVFYLLTFFTSPMRLFGSIALLSGISGIAIGGGLALTKIYHGIIGGLSGFHAYEIGNRPLLLLAILLIVVGVQLLMMGFLGEMMMRIYYEAREQPAYYIRRVLDNTDNISDVFSPQKYRDTLDRAHHQRGERNAE